MVNIIIAEDEEILLHSLAHKLQKFWPDAQIIRLCRSGEEALAALDELKPQVAFLDIQMGKLTGIDVAFCTGQPCHFVFVTAYDQYAVKAFDAGAIDYLLKPYSDSRLLQCISKLQEKLHRPPIGIEQLFSQPQLPANFYLKRLKLQIGNRIWLQSVDEVIYFQASGRYVEVVTTARQFVVRMALKNLLQQLDPEMFWRIHRSIVININFLDHVKADDPDQLSAMMKHISKPLPVSRSSQHLFKIPASE
ncbi:hypothetical protein A5320_12095 [Rheinheimera sp. SA_1]|uniref:LytR/AlgR family response regulator transcription factor n=1 Tax=Rheinheimera sp. SA_1 TaxID=1827365 RepID=UPI0007FC6690|nr:LytTR family DNA-binding domain-containing protein [Rheinheimera sp. SA_1]OBP14503.1 hypothetical protein A5320_12095 [Rheinheimera sp. SA_1]